MKRMHVEDGHPWTGRLALEVRDMNRAIVKGDWPGKTGRPPTTEEDRGAAGGKDQQRKETVLAGSRSGHSHHFMRVAPTRD